MTKEQLIQDYKAKIKTYKQNMNRSTCESNKRQLRALIKGYELKIKELL